MEETTDGTNSSTRGKSATGKTDGSPQTITKQPVPFSPDPKPNKVAQKSLQAAPSVAPVDATSRSKPDTARNGKFGTRRGATPASLLAVDDDTQQPPAPPGGYRVGLGDHESRISNIGVVSPAIGVPPDPIGHVQENVARVSNRVSERDDPDPSGASPIQAELVDATEAIERVEVLAGASHGRPGTRPSPRRGGSLSRNVDELRKRVRDNSSRNRVTLIVAAVILLAAVAGGVAVALVATRKNGDDGSPTQAPTPPEEPSLSRQDVEDGIVLLSPSTSFSDPTSPQRKAIDWLSGDVFSQDLMQSGDNELPRLLQRFGLATLFFATQGQNWKSNSNWLSAVDECIGWTGVICNNGSVSHLNLQENRLYGSIPTEVFVFLKDSIHVFNLARNELFGTIPTVVGELPQLLDLRLFENQLTGTIPTEVANLSLIRHFAINLNKLSGTVPPMPNQGQLTWLTLRDNGLHGSLPNDLRDLVSLEQLFIFGTDLTGSVSSTLCDTLWRAWIDCGEVQCDCCSSFQDVPCP